MQSGGVPSASINFIAIVPPDARAEIFILIEKYIRRPPPAHCKYASYINILYYNIHNSFSLKPQQRERQRERDRERDRERESEETQYNH